jgi:hypothetical protein
MIKDTSYSVDIRLRRIGEKLVHLTAQDDSALDVSIDLEDKSEITKQYLLVCEDAKNFIESLTQKESAVRQEARRNISPDDVQNSFEAQLLTRQALDENRAGFRDIIGRLQARLDSLLTNGDRCGKERLALQEEIQLSRQCLEVCKMASEVSRQTVYRIGEVGADGDNSARDLRKNTEDLADTSGTYIHKDGPPAANEDNDSSGRPSMISPLSTYIHTDGLGEAGQSIVQRAGFHQRLQSTPASMSDEASIPLSLDEFTQLEASSFGVTTLLNTQGRQMPELEPLPSPTSTNCDTLEDDDCISVESDNNDISSQAATMRTRPEILAVRHIASFLCELEELRPLHEEALKKLGPKRFQQNYRRILKVYVLRLQIEAQTAVQKDIIRVLKSRFNRTSMAQRIIDLIQEDKDDSAKPLNVITLQPVEKQSLEDWIKDTHGPTVADAVGSNFEDHDQLSTGSGSEEDEEEYRVEEFLFPNLTNADRFLHGGLPFQTLLLELTLLVLPASLRQIVESTPKHLIHVSSTNDMSLSNIVKGFVEDHTAFEWDWWPLTPRVPDIPPGRFRLQWSVSNLWI